MCSLLMQHRVIDSSYLLRKKWRDSVWAGLLQLSNRLQVFLVEQGILWTFFCIFFVVYLYWSSMITKYEVLNGYVIILSAILGVRLYTAIMKKMGKLWILACCQVSWLVPASIWWIFHPCKWLQWNIVKGLKVFILCGVCVFGSGVCFCLLLNMQGHGLS